MITNVLWCGDKLHVHRCAACGLWCQQECGCVNPGRVEICWECDVQIQADMEDAHADPE